MKTELKPFHATKDHSGKSTGWLKFGNYFFNWGFGCGIYEDEFIVVFESINYKWLRFLPRFKIEREATRYELEELEEARILADYLERDDQLCSQWHD